MLGSVVVLVVMATAGLTDGGRVDAELPGQKQEGPPQDVDVHLDTDTRHALIGAEPPRSDWCRDAAL